MSEVSIPTCACGTFAVGQCADCQEPICHRHSAMLGRHLRCGAHARVFHEAEREKHQRDRASDRDRWDLAVASFLQAMSDAGNPGSKHHYVVKVGRTTFTRKGFRFRRAIRGWPVGHDSGSTAFLCPDGSLFFSPTFSSWNLVTGRPGPDQPGRQADPPVGWWFQMLNERQTHPGSATPSAAGVLIDLLGAHGLAVPHEVRALA